MRSSSPPARRHTQGLEPAAEAQVAQDLARLSTGLESELGDAVRSLLLVGPFARGEGRMYKGAHQLSAALPGYELLVVTRRSPERFERVLPAISATWSRLLGARVALFAVAETTLHAPPRTRTYLHAGAGQVLELLADTARSVVPAAFGSADLAPGEADQALLEGLCALALARLEAPHDAQRVLDRTQRALLSCGDAALIAHGLYDPTLRERAAALPRTGTSSSVVAAYGALAELVSPQAADDHAARAGADALQRTLIEGVLELQAARTGSPRDLGAFLRAPAVAPGSSERAARTPGWLATVQWTASLVGLIEPEPVPLVPRAQLLHACAALALGGALPESLRCAARLLAPALDSRAARHPDAAAVLAALRRAARVALAPRVAQPFGNWALVPTPP